MGGRTQLDVSSGGSTDSTDVMNGKCDHQHQHQSCKTAKILLVSYNSVSRIKPLSRIKGDAKWELEMPGVTKDVKAKNRTLS